MNAKVEVIADPFPESKTKDGLTDKERAEQQRTNKIRQANHYAQLDQEFEEGKIPEYSGHYAEAKARFASREAAKKIT